VANEYRRRDLSLDPTARDSFGLFERQDAAAPSLRREKGDPQSHCSDDCCDIELHSCG